VYHSNRSIAYLCRGKTRELAFRRRRTSHRLGQVLVVREVLSEMSTVRPERNDVRISNEPSVRPKRRDVSSSTRLTDEGSRKWRAIARAQRFLPVKVCKIRINSDK
jgi:hypothetical protein